MTLDEYLSLPGCSAKQLAADIGVPAPLISQWRKGVRPVPAERCPAIERATGGAVTCEELRPDVDWAYLRGSGAPPGPRSSPPAQLDRGASEKNAAAAPTAASTAAAPTGAAALSAGAILERREAA